ncbi:LmeA family phospholipid-binding protein [Nocardia goodfellowii]|uniref:DUF2993 domain-containing protein n=1 Tax=Nocardia goodfellowii TaxID=882446 RepID=A0ABS4QQM4_9NOCA|nr:DUF2993 domain-containing protein [Nocardia goodfellowii]MBP2192941.1 hypothetical protein [Nocardia goodfellowii]
MALLIFAFILGLSMDYQVFILERDLGSKVSVSFGPKPLLLTAIDHQVQYVSLDSDDVGFGSAMDLKVHARLNDITLIDDGRGGADVGSSSVEATWSNDGIAQTLKGLVSEVRTDSRTGVLELQVLGGIADLQVTPHIVGGRVEANTRSAQLFGIGLPTDLADSIVELLTKILQSYPMDLKPTEVRITDSGITVRPSGGATRLQPDQNGETISC